ncbi:uncharacterized protein RAG0_13810 [Rhynchosporium agropyri]|uniref:Uncharacterized protein n=1 Tax=Rhynchosporium agropyri TaxID=914238 RepID=A0A1E1LEC2_9HELO|nr:uncharacterized protein RAG0_13810 [Rhynchosporium agropyri]
MPSPMTRHMDLASINETICRSRDDTDEANHRCDDDPKDSRADHRVGPTGKEERQHQHADAH